jgi:ABC-2 type transport system ATP-binding protein
VRRRWVEKHAVNDVSFRVDEGEIVGLLGPNGAGKTTLVKMLAGIIHPSAGEARVLGFTPWERATEFRRQIALIMGQKAQLWWDLPAADCFLLLKEIYEIPTARYRDNLDYLATILGVTAELQVPIRRLSLGERMKMELIAALLHSPRVVFLDEPTIGLDLTAQKAVRDFVLKYREEHRPAMVVTSHYMEDIRRLCPRILIVKDGGIVYDGRLDRVAGTFADHRVVTAHVRREDGPPTAAPDLSDLGEVLERSDVVVKVRVPTGRVAEAAAAILQRLPVADLTIEEPDVGTVIERIYRDREKDR